MQLWWFLFTESVSGAVVGAEAGLDAMQGNEGKGTNAENEGKGTNAESADTKNQNRSHFHIDWNKGMEIQTYVSNILFLVVIVFVWPGLLLG